MSKRFYRPELDGLRFFAFCIVFVHHIAMSETFWKTVLRDIGSYGMSLFFLLSAYLIVALLLKERASSGTINVRTFFVRRLLRIWPLYFVIIAFAAVFGHLFPPARVGGHVLLAFSLMLGNVYVLTHGWNYLAWATPMWSLSVEEQFYVVVPTTVRSLRPRVLAMVSAGVICVSYAVLAHLSFAHAIPAVRMWPNSFIEFQFFAAGALLALWTDRNIFRAGRMTRGALMISGGALWLTAAIFGGLQSSHPVEVWQPLLGYPLVLAGTILIFLSVFNIEATIPSWLAYLGKITYGLYMFHNLFLWLVTYHVLLGQPYALRLIGAAVATLITASLSYRYIEKPFLRLKTRFEVVHSRPA